MSSSALIEAVVDTLFEAVLLVVLVVVLFLQTWRASIIPLVAVPISLVGTFAFMQLMGFSLNALSVFGLVLAIGIVVDDAIVVVENVDAARIVVRVTDSKNSNNAVDMVALLIEKGADVNNYVNEKTQKAPTSLMYAIYRYSVYLDPTVIDLLLSNGADINYKSTFLLNCSQQNATLPIAFNLSVCVLTGTITIKA